MTSQTASKVTDRQILEMKRQLEVVAYRYLSLESAQMIIERGDVFQSRLGDLLRELGGMFPNQYESERVDRTLDNPAGWSVPSFDEQRARTAKLFPDLVLPETPTRDIVVPNGWDGVWWFPPKIAAIGRICGVADCYIADYGTVVKHLLTLIKKQRAFINYRTLNGDQLTAEYVRINENVRGRIQMLEAATGGDFLPPMPITFGQFYGGFSPRNARETAIRRQELPFCTAQVGSLLAVMPERLAAHDLWIDIPADEYHWGGDNLWAHSLYFYFGDGGLMMFDSGGAADAAGRCGSAVGLPGVSEFAS
ncbi:MAG TPA: hypothetical protein VJL27_00475 [Patescibacteria group bacterium]|nr:hypothetical protein [Patescibacteria group bacterium]